MFKPKYAKEGELLLKGVTRFVHYRRDRLPPESLERIQTHCEELRQGLKRRDREKVETASKQLQEACDGAAPTYRTSAIGENVEVIFVAIAIALGIRAYFLQPFRIPTGSMQPTLDGIISYPTPDVEPPNFLVQSFDLVIRGRAWVNAVARQDDRVVDYTEVQKLKFFTFTRIECESGEVYTLHAPLQEVMELGLRRILNSPGQQVKEGEVIARGFVDTGDQVLVDKMSYHFIPPIRGEVFVFTTDDITHIEAGIDPRFGSQHYIKRLAGLPDDELLINSPELFVNGERGDAFGFERVMSMEEGYRGYSGSGQRVFNVPDDRYVALGDNSYNSSDSREWGYVPEENLVGRALFVYWPFRDHWGPIR